MDLPEYYLVLNTSISVSTDEPGVGDVYQPGDKISGDLLRDEAKRSFSDNLQPCLPPADALDLGELKKDELLELSDEIGLSNSETNGLKKAELIELIQQEL